MVATLPVKYTGAVVLGSNISGLFAAIVQICSAYIFSSYRTSAIYYFITAMLVLLICFDTYFALPLNVSNMYRYGNKYNIYIYICIYNLYIYIIHSYLFIYLFIITVFFNLDIYISNRINYFCNI